MSDAVEVLAAAVTALCQERFVDVDSIAALAIDTLGGPDARRADLAIEPRCRELLATTVPPLAGAGIVVAPNVLASDPYLLEWWLPGPEDGSEPTRLSADLNPASVTFRDYTTLAWFAEPQETRQPTITGPYVDYLCTDQYSLTFTTPMFDGDRFLGVAGVDVLARWFEQHLFSVLDAAGCLDEGAVVVNRTGRVVACSSGDWVTGDLIRAFAGDPGAGWQVTVCPGTPFVVARRRP